MTNKRVKYFDTNDLMYGYNLEKIIYMNIPKYDDIEINDAIEYCEIHKYFEKKIIRKDWTEEEIEQYTNKSKELYKLTMRFFNSITDENIISEYRKIDDVDYRSIFFELFDRCKLYDKISKDIFEQIVSNEEINSVDLFKYNKVVNKYGEILRKYILNNLTNIRIIIYLYKQQLSNGKKLHTPNEITSNDINEYILNYIKSEKPHLNFLESIMLMQSKEKFQITDKIKLEAKKRYEKEKERILENNKQSKIIMPIEFSENQIEKKKYDKENNKTSYSINWLKDTLDYPSIINNFIYIFEYVDCFEMRSNHVNKQSNDFLFERISKSISKSRSQRIYPINTVFKIDNDIARIQMSYYYSFLKEHKIRLEDVLEYYFTEYFSSEFGMDKIKVKFPSEGTTYSEKCTLIFTAFETIIKQFSLYVKDGNIDYDLVSMSTTPMLFKNIPSFIDNKYVYGNGEDFERLTCLLFSDQSKLKYIPRILEKKKTYTSFYELILNEKIYLRDYNSLDNIDYLKSHNIIEIADDELLSIGDKYKVLILKDLFYNEVISRYHCRTTYQNIIDDLIDKKILKQKSSLFSDNEVNYLNYLLNRAEYDNGLEIRNSYIHGNQHVIEDESKHEQNYYRILIIMVLLAIKINDDFCLNEKINKSEKNNT